MNIVVLGLSITSSWGNGHATTYRGLMRELVGRGHDVLFLERDVPWYAQNRDLPQPPYGRTELYRSLTDLKDRFAQDIRQADLVMAGSYVPEGIAVGEWITRRAQGLTAFYDIDTPVTLANVERGSCEYVTSSLIRRYQLYLSFTGGPTLQRIERKYGSPMARVLYCSADPTLYYPENRAKKWDLGYLGTYSEDRQQQLHNLMLAPARCWPEGRFLVAGPLYPEQIEWPANVERLEHLAPDRHRDFYGSQRVTLNITRAEMTRAGYSPSVRLFEAAACATPTISDYWEGLETIFEIGSEILVARSPEETLRYIHQTPDEQLTGVGCRARAKVLARHTPAHRAQELEAYVAEATGRPPISSICAAQHLG